MDPIVPRRLLFVCGGNTCRSPMARWLAMARWPTRVVADSAGQSPVPCEDAWNQARGALLRRGIDPTEHDPKGIDGLDLRSFDVIVVLDRDVAADVFLGPRPANVLVRHVADPFRVGTPVAYDGAASEISSLLEQHKDWLLTPSAADGASTTSAAPAIERWRTLLAGPELAPTWVRGIATGAFGLLEQHLRGELRRELARSAKAPLDLRSLLTKPAAEIDLDRLPLGLVAASLSELDPGRWKDALKDVAHERNELVKAHSDARPGGAGYQALVRKGVERVAALLERAAPPEAT